MLKRKDFPLPAYVVACGAVGLVVGFDRLLWPLQEPSICPPLLIAVLLSAWYGGLGPGLLASLLASTLTEWVPSSHSGDPHPRLLDASDVLRFATYLSAALVVGLLNRARARAEAALHESQKLFESFMDNSPIAAYVKDEQGRYLYLNQPALKMLNRPAADCLGKNDSQLFPPDVAARILEHDAKLLATGQPLQHEMPMKQADGMHHLLGCLFPFTNRSGVRYLAGLSLDITSLRKAERERDRLIALLDACLASVPLGLAFFDRELRYLRINDFLAGMNGLTPQEHIGRSLKEVLPAMAPFFEPFLRRVLESGQPCLDIELMHPLPARPQEPRYWLLNYFPIHGPDGAVLGVGLAVEDITRIRLADIQLTLAKEAAEEANAAKDQFLAVLSHELRTPLTPTLMALSSLQARSDLPESALESLAMARRNLDLEVRFIEDLLDVTRIRRGKLQLSLQDADAHQVIDQALEACRNDLEAKEIQLQVDLAASSHHLCADPARLHQVFTNLLKNAIKFTPAGGAITLRTWNGQMGEGEKGRIGESADRRIGDIANCRIENLQESALSTQHPGLFIEVADTGPGIPPAHLERIFEPFEQGDAQINRRFGGLGLGLAISRAIVSMHQGRIWAYSAGANQGATFTVKLPLLAGPPQPPPAAPAATLERVRVQPQRILLVEDHADTARVLTCLLEDYGFVVRSAGSVAQALHAAAEQEFDLVISDIGLPDGYGTDLMRQLLQRRPIPGIALSGYGMDSDVRQSHEAGFLEHLTKPVSLAMLEAALRRVLAALDERGPAGQA